MLNHMFVCFVLEVGLVHPELKVLIILIALTNYCAYAVVPFCALDLLSGVSNFWIFASLIGV